MEALSVSEVEAVVAHLGRLPGVLGSLVVGRDGLVVINTLLDEADSEFVAALASSMYGTVGRALQRLGAGQLHHVVLQGSRGSVFLMEAGDLVLVVLAEPDLRPDLLHAALTGAATEVGRTLSV